MDTQDIIGEEVKSIINKVKENTATPEEELALLKFLNSQVDELSVLMNK